jgi:hypothetical protein
MLKAFVSHKLKLPKLSCTEGYGPSTFKVGCILHLARILNTQITAEAQHLGLLHQRNKNGGRTSAECVRGARARLERRLQNG